MTTPSIFNENYLVCGLTPVQVEKVASLATNKRLTAGETLITHGQAGDNLYVILDGRLNVLAEDGDKLAEVGPGSVLGEIALIDAQPCSAHVVCVGLVAVAVLPVKDVRALMRGDKELGFTVLANLARVLCGRLRQADKKLCSLMDEVHGGAWNNAL